MPPPQDDYTWIMLALIVALLVVLAIMLATAFGIWSVQLQ